MKKSLFDWCPCKFGAGLPCAAGECCWSHTNLQTKKSCLDGVSSVHTLNASSMLKSQCQNVYTLMLNVFLPYYLPCFVHQTHRSVAKTSSRNIGSFFIILLFNMVENKL